MNLFVDMPISSKRELLKNIDTNYSKIMTLKNYYSQIVPPNYTIYIKFHPTPNLFENDESIDFWVWRNNYDTNIS